MTVSEDPWASPDPWAHTTAPVIPIRPPEEPPCNEPGCDEDEGPMPTPDPAAELPPIEVDEKADYQPIVADPDTPKEWWSDAITADELDTLEFPPLTYLVDQILITGGVVLLGGAPKIGKSFLSAGIGLAVAQGGKAFGKLNTDQADVLLITPDDASKRRHQTRLRAMNHNNPLPKTLTIITDATPLGRGHEAAHNLNLYLHQHPQCGLIIIDTGEHLRPPRSGKNSAYTDDVKFLQTLRTVITDHPTVTILVLAHTRKENNKGEDDDPIAAITGTHGVTGGADAILRLSGKRGTPKRLLSQVSRDGGDTELVFTWTGHGLELTDDDPNDPTVQMTPDDARVYTTVAEFPNGVTAKDLEPLLPEIKKMGNRLASLSRSGHLIRQARGVYTTP